MVEFLTNKKLVRFWGFWSKFYGNQAFSGGNYEEKSWYKFCEEQNP
jgi:hypothetical protein